MNAPQALLVVIAASKKDTSDKIKNGFRDLAKKWRLRTDGSGIVHGREVVFTWMNTDSWGTWMKDGHYDHYRDLEDVKVIIADHSVCYFLFFFVFLLITLFFRM